MRGDFVVCVDAGVGGDVHSFSPNNLPLGPGIKKTANAGAVAGGRLKQQTPGFSRIAFGLKPPSHYVHDHQLKLMATYNEERESLRQQHRPLVQLFVF